MRCRVLTLGVQTVLTSFRLWRFFSACVPGTSFRLRYQSFRPRAFSRKFSSFVFLKAGGRTTDVFLEIRHAGLDNSVLLSPSSCLHTYLGGQIARIRTCVITPFCSEHIWVHLNATRSCVDVSKKNACNPKNVFYQIKIWPVDAF